MKIISKQLGNKDMIRGGPETKPSKFQNTTKIAKTVSITNLRVYLRKWTMKCKRFKRGF